MKCLRYTYNTTRDILLYNKINNTYAKYYSLISMQDKPILHLNCVEVKCPHTSNN
jgi:hypothetical protein